MRIHHIALRSPAPEKLAHFYRQVLGLRLVYQDAQRAWWFSLDDCDDDDGNKNKIPAAVLMIERAQQHEPLADPAGMELLAFARSADERSLLCSRLKAQGVEIEEEGVNTSYFRDPEGRRLGISQFDFATFLSAVQTV